MNNYFLYSIYQCHFRVLWHFYGWVDSLYDESGVVCYEYGNMGEVTRETRIYALPFLTNALALSTQFGYDSWGRVDSIIYPDNETVKYRYDCGGQLQSIYNRQVPAYSYLDNVTYDRFGAKVSQEYGNGMITSYAYDSYTRGLSQITVTDNSSNPYGDIQYGYDPVGNVTQVTSTCPWLTNRNFTETFTYDASDQLTAATETQHQGYQLAVSYGNWGKISSYSLVQADLQNNTTQSEIQAYTYPVYNSLQDAQTLFAPQQRTITDISNNVATETLTFAINGSLRKREVQSLSPYTEYYLFNSAANLKAYSNNTLDFAYYGYNVSNTRTYKLSMLNQNQWINGQSQPLDLHIQHAMFYPNAYLNFNQNGEYTKHYYNGSERIASRLGDNTQTMDATSNGRLDYRLMREEEKFRENMQELVSEWHPVDLHGSVALVALQPTGTATDIFYYHPNHLGSTAYVTDQNQNVTQGFLYAPFGEITTEYNATFGNDVIPKYAFNAKELDEETGMYYYEAHYYKPPVFTSRDAMFEKYFWMTPYAYCANNPVKYVDPDGEDVRLIGVDIKTAFKEFKKGAKRYGVKIKMDRHGNISGKYMKHSEKSIEGRMIMSALEDHSVEVIMNTTYGSITEDNLLFIGGAFLGSTLNKDGSAVAHQDINPGDLKRISDFYGKPGQDILHEITEAYYGAKIAQLLGQSICNSNENNDTYNWAHNSAIPQSGEVIGPIPVTHNGLPEACGGKLVGCAWDLKNKNGETIEIKRYLFE